MKLVDKFVNFFIKGGAKGKIIGLSVLAIGNVASIVSVSVAWFSMNNQESRIDMVAGDLNVDIRKVTAYKQVYPYYKNSTEFIDYDAEPTLRSYVIEDNCLTYPESDTIVNDDDFTWNGTATIALTTNVSGSYVSGAYDSLTPQQKANLGPTNIHYPGTADFRYFLVGDGVFCGDDNAWTSTDGLAFANKEDVDNNHSVSIDNVVIAKGATFIIFDKNNAETNKYLAYSTVSSGAPFVVVDNGIQCLKAGVYKVTYAHNQITIELRNFRDAIISNNSLDPTKVNIDYIGSTNKTNYPNVNDYLPIAIYNQNSMVVLDVELNYKNVNTIEAGLNVQRGETAPSNSISASGGYSNTSANLVGGDQYPLKASDFYSFYSVLTKTSIGTGQGTWSSSDMWNTLHRNTDAEEETYEIYFRHAGGWSNLVLSSKEVNGDIVYFRQNVAFEKDDIFRINLNGTWRNHDALKSDSFITTNFMSDGTGDKNIKTKISGTYDIYITETPDGSGKSISIQAAAGASEPARVPYDNIFCKFVNATGAQNYDSSIECTLFGVNGDTTIIEPSSTDNIYHCYIGIDYDYIFTRYFLNENRLGKTYYLYRDYGFYFTGTQVFESNS